MMNSFTLFDTDQRFMPHGHCYLWDPTILWMNVGSDAVIAISYFAIPLFLVLVVRRHRDLSFNGIFYLFALFIIACGTTHWMGIWTVWQPNYGLQGVFKVITACASLGTALALIPLVKKIALFPSHSQLRAIVQQLEQEVVERRMAEFISKESEERFRLLLAGVKDTAIYMIDPEGYITTWNQGAEGFKGYRAEEVLGQHFSIFYTAEDRAKNQPFKDLEFARNEGWFEAKAIRVRKDRTQFWANTLMTALKNSAGELIGFVKVTRDISQAKRAEENLKLLNENLEKRVEDRTRELARQEKQLRTITDALPILIAKLDHKQHVLFGNEMFQKLVRLSAHELVGIPLRDMVAPDAYESVQEHFQEALQGKKVDFVREEEHEGARKFMQVSYIPEVNEQGKVYGVIILATDISEHRRVEEELKQAKEAAEAANSAKSSFLANMSHEIRTPLGAVLGFSELIVHSNLSEQDRASYAAVIRRNGEFLSSIINDILDLSKVEAGKFDIEIQQVSTQEIVIELSSLLNLLATEKGIALQITPVEVLPPTIRTDPLRLKQILLNIVGNAIKFTEKGRVKVTIQSQAGMDGLVRLAFVVEDTGLGISEEQAGKLFAPFIQADASTKRRFGGTGLGLILSKQLAKLLGGDVVLTSSQINVGSIFTITIDPKGGQALQADFPEKLSRWARPIPALSTFDNSYLDGVSVLVVDDAVDNQFLVSHYLKNAGAQIDTANNGREAIQKALENNYHILLMDLQMPIMDGFEATEALRNQGFQQPIIALTAHALKEDRMRCLSRGFTDYISKPINRQELLSRVARYTREKQA